ncbi:olfactory receptor 13D1-like [Aquarana catesbeiana]|uniref:olfactory receptor 13D1-like n=1 Tax=Aquarana catesbeiana TaxID=8400 RepID=UPI003CC95ED1
MYTQNQSTVTEFILLGLSSDTLVQVLLFHIFLVVYMTTLTGNVLLMVAVRTDKRLHTSMYIFLSSLSFLDICYTSSTVPKMLVNFLSPKKSISFTGCVVQFYVSLIMGQTECLLLAFMAYDRYVAICIPLRYNIIMNRMVSFCMIGISWSTGCMASSIVTFLTFRLKFCGPNIINHFFCQLPLLLRLSCSDISVINIIKLVSIPIVLFIPLSLILISYIRIITAVLKIRLGKSKAFSTCIPHLVVVVFFYGSAMFMYGRPEHLVTGDTDKRVSVFYTVITPMLNPLIYSLRNKDVQGAMRRLIRA